MSQDRHEIFLTIASYDDNYIKYLRGEGEESHSFLEMQEYGPFAINKSDHMYIFGRTMLALSLADGRLV